MLRRSGREEGSPIGEGCVKKDQCGHRKEGGCSGGTTTSGLRPMGPAGAISGDTSGNGG
jgi:hypothetical protein